MVTVFLNGHSTPDKRVQPKRKVASPHDQIPPPALPINGVEYGVGEFIGIIQLYRRRFKEWGGMIRKMMSPRYSYLMRSRRAVYNVILEHEKGRMFDFSGHGVIMVGPKS